MGAETRVVTFEHCATTADLNKRWSVAQDEDAYQRGHDSYRGCIRDVHIERITARYPTLADAQKAATAANNRGDIDKRLAWAFPFGDPAKAFPQTAGDKALVASHDKVTASVDSFEMDVLKRFLASKSASKKCVHCDSVISKKSRASLATPAAVAELQRLRTTKGPFERYLEYRDGVHELTACPACRRELLMTATDLARKAALEAKAKDLEVRKSAAFKKFETTSKPYGYLVVASVPT